MCDMGPLKSDSSHKKIPFQTRGERGGNLKHDGLEEGREERETERIRAVGAVRKRQHRGRVRRWLEREGARNTQTERERQRLERRLRERKITESKEERKTET